jgi:hypothetical protein
MPAPDQLGLDTFQHSTATDAGPHS